MTTAYVCDMIGAGAGMGIGFERSDKDSDIGVDVGVWITIAKRIVEEKARNARRIKEKGGGGVEIQYDTINEVHNTQQHRVWVWKERKGKERGNKEIDGFQRTKEMGMDVP